MFEACSIRPLIFEDLSNVLAWRNHPNIRQFMFSQHEIDFAEHYAWFLKASQDKNRRLLIVEHKQQPIGFAQLSNISHSGIADWGFYVRPGSQKGSGKKLGYTVLNYAFETLRLNKIRGQAIESNLTSIALHKKLGFEQECILYNHQCIDGVYHTLICLDLLKKKWPPKQIIEINKSVEN